MNDRLAQSFSSSALQLGILFAIGLMSSTASAQSGIGGITNGLRGLSAARNGATTCRVIEPLLATRNGVTLGGTPIPDAVKELVARARAAGAVSYDVTTGDYSPYGATAPAEENMAFAYTEVTPASLQADIDLVGPQPKIIAYEPILGANGEPLRGADGEIQEQIVYGTMEGGTGSISAAYDHSMHSDLYARSISGDKWANNFGILEDGSLHALPAARRSVLQNSILTNPDLARVNLSTGEPVAKMMFNGHLDVDRGVVVGVEMSGRIARRAASGRDIFIDPIALIKAWGIPVAPDVTLVYGNTRDGVPVIDAVNGVIGKANATP